MKLNKLIYKIANITKETIGSIIVFSLCFVVFIFVYLLGLISGNNHPIKYYPADKSLRNKL
jgi:hypothetical protein